MLSCQGNPVHPESMIHCIRNDKPTIEQLCLIYVECFVLRSVLDFSARRISNLCLRRTLDIIEVLRLPTANKLL